jgi:hypothetical protein
VVHLFNKSAASSWLEEYGKHVFLYPNKGKTFAHEDYNTEVKILYEIHMWRQPVASASAGKRSKSASMQGIVVPH